MTSPAQRVDTANRRLVLIASVTGIVVALVAVLAAITLYTELGKARQQVAAQNKPCPTVVEQIPSVACQLERERAARSADAAAAAQRSAVAATERRELLRVLTAIRVSAVPGQPGVVQLTVPPSLRLPAATSTTMPTTPTPRPAPAPSRAPAPSATPQPTPSPPSPGLVDGLTCGTLRLLC